jgi:hypothetical protein
MTNNKIISFLFGAGASCHALPIVDQIPDAIEEFLSEIKDEKFLVSDTEGFNFPNLKHSKRDFQEEMWRTLEWMKDGAKNHASIDTFAKKLLITDQYRELIKLKAGLTCFFIYLQTKNNIDKRYDSFFAALINPSRQIYNLPDNLRVLSWNYDFQFEKAYSAYTKESNLGSNQSRLNISPSHLRETEEDRFAIFKLNGTTDVHNIEWNIIENLHNSLNSTIDAGFMEVLVNSYAGFTRYSNKYKPLLTFAWESDIISNQVLESAIKSTKDTEILVVIGYSFPFFNRDIDRKIIGEMKNLKKVYFQAPGREAHNYIDRFQAIRNDLHHSNLIPIEDVNQFFLPHEL